jgi:hypothetical protein
MTITRRHFVAGASAAGGIATLGALATHRAHPGASGATIDDGAPLCATCGVQRSIAGSVCPVCDDERQYVGSGGQRWITLGRLAQDHRNTITELEPGLWSIRTVPAFAIGQHALLVATAQGNVLWDCLSVIDDATIRAIDALGGVAAIAISHPHFYGVMRAWSRAFGAPIWIHEADRAWIPAPAPEVRTWSGSTMSPLGDLALVHVGGHFEGSQVLHWPGGAGGRGAILAGDQPNLCADRRWFTFMRSFPNYIPLSPDEADRVVAAFRPLAFDRLYGWTPDRAMASSAKSSLERSLDRHVRALRGEHGAVPWSQRG